MLNDWCIADTSLTADITCVLRIYFKDAHVLDNLFSYSLIKKKDLIPACTIPVEMNDVHVNYNADQSKFIYSCGQADKYMYYMYKQFD